jgi:hypothetical protein
MPETNIRDELVAAAEWVIGSGVDPDDCDICEDGSVYYGLTMILPRGSMEPAQLA